MILVLDKLRIINILDILARNTLQWHLELAYSYYLTEDQWRPMCHFLPHSPLINSIKVCVDVITLRDDGDDAKTVICPV